jgi:uncharacterized membrane protein YhaH (DUF805 family)
MREVLRKLPGFFKPGGKYNRSRYRSIISIISLVFLGLYLLWNYYQEWLPVVIAVGVPVYYIEVVSSIKRLRDLGRPARNYLLTFVPYVNILLRWSLWYDLIGEARVDQDDRDYHVQEYYRKQRGKAKPYGGGRDVGGRYDDFRF